MHLEFHLPFTKFVDVCQKKRVMATLLQIPGMAKIVYQQQKAANPAGKSLGRRENYPRNCQTLLSFMVNTSQARSLICPQRTKARSQFKPHEKP